MNEKMRVNLSEILPIIEEQLAEGKTVSFSPNGISMQPMLYAGRDSVTLTYPPQKLKKYDLPLYRRTSGQFVLHRVVKVSKDGSYVMCGDNQQARENGIKHEQIIGIVTEFTRNRKSYTCKNPIYHIYCRIHVKKQYIYGLYLRGKRKISLIIKKILTDKDD